jgi:Na+/H+ antiporter NhaD/arsenite permease-like protein
MVSLLIPLAITARALRGQDVVAPVRTASTITCKATHFEKHLMLFLGLGIMVLVPAFKAVTGLPPFMGILFGAGDLVGRGRPTCTGARRTDDKEHLTLVRALTKIDMSSIVFFIGILLAVATLEHTHILSSLAHWLDKSVGQIDVIVMLIGLGSAIVDNVPLVAASMGMYNLAQYPTDSFLWEFLAYCAGTGGSILIIGSAAGVAAMGLEKISFGWYMRRISLLALVGYIAGAMVYILQYRLTH